MYYKFLQDARLLVPVQLLGVTSYLPIHSAVMASGSLCEENMIYWIAARMSVVFRM